MQARNPGQALVHARALAEHPRAATKDLMDVAGLAENLLDNQTALEALRIAHHRAPRDIATHLRLAEFEHFCGHTTEAFAQLDLVLKKCRSVRDLMQVGATYGRFGESARAYEVFSQAALKDPGNPAVKENCAIGLAFLGRIEEAERIYDDLIAKGAPSGVTYLNRSGLRRQTEEANHIDQLRDTIAKMPGREPFAPYLFHALAKEYEDLGQFEQSFECLAKASAQRRRSINYSVDAEIRTLERIAEIFDESYFEGRAEGCPSAEPIFIVGMPRTGSTLAERFIANHSQVVAAGELQNFDLMVQLRMSELAVSQGRYQIQDRSYFYKNVDMFSVGESYINSTRPRTGATPYFIDKNPNNFVNIGAIVAALPNAKIVHMERNPMDTCYAMFKQPFENAYEFSYDQAELAKYFAAYRKLMAHWNTVLPGRVIRLRYEDLVNDSEGTMRGLLQRLELQWEDACMDHRANEAASMTPSATQVRQPIYASSIGKWRNFEVQLAPLKQALQGQGIEVA